MIFVPLHAHNSGGTVKLPKEQKKTLQCVVKIPDCSHHWAIYDYLIQKWHGPGRIKRKIKCSSDPFSLIQFSVAPTQRHLWFFYSVRTICTALQGKLPHLENSLLNKCGFIVALWFLNPFTLFVMWGWMNITETQGLITSRGFWCS